MHLEGHGYLFVSDLLVTYIKLQWHYLTVQWVVHLTGQYLTYWAYET